MLTCRVTAGKMAAEVVHPVWDWVKQAITIIAAAGSAYMGIRLDLAKTAADVTYLQQTQARHRATD